MSDWFDFVDAEKLSLIFRAQGRTAGEKIENLIITMKAKGMSDEAIIKVMLKDFNEGGRIFGPVINLFAKSTGFGLDFITQEGVGTGREDKKTLYTWLTTSGKPCPDCVPRHLQSKTYPEWERIGLPGSGFSVCGDSCMCVLVEEEYVPGNFGEPVEVPPLSEVRKKFQERMKEYKIGDEWLSPGLRKKE